MIQFYQFKVIFDICVIVWDECDYVVWDGQVNFDIELGKIYMDLLVVNNVFDGIFFQLKIRRFCKI